jgi:DNA-binding NarL/FixJ family response regulator
MDGDQLRSARVVIVDDHELFRAGVRTEIGKVHVIVGEAGTPSAAIAVINEQRPDVVLLDVHLPDGGGVAVLEALRGDADAPAFLALSASDATEDVVEVMRAGALGYATKTIAVTDLVQAISQVAAGEAYFSARLAALVLQTISSPQSSAQEADQRLLASLTPREREILHHLARGYSYKRIALTLDIGTRTVESHSRSVLRKLQLSSRNEVAYWVTSRGLDDDAPA